MSILQNIHGHDDLQALSKQEQAQLCREIRSFLVENVGKTGGHLSSNLGITELSVAIETVYNTQVDRLVFDVGHQSYVHKLLTGRQADFARLRQFGGMSGFPKPSESESDAFVAGHASNSVSIALGMARARSLRGEDHDVIAVIGDGAATGGMAYEGLNDAAVSGEPMVVILNDNAMSIAPNVGGFAQHLSRLRSKAGYIGLKNRLRKSLSRNRLGRGIYRLSRRFKDRVKRFFLPSTIFENMGWRYLGPVDGNDLQGMIDLLRLAKSFRCPVLIHVHTQKGRGYGPAEENPAKFHGVGPFDPATGQSLKPGKPSFSDAFGEAMLELGRQQENLCAITAAMPAGTGLKAFMAAFPERTFDVGIAEEHAVSMAGGLAKAGMIPVVAIYSTFLQRGFDQILQDVAMLGLHVVLAVDRAGLVGEDGQTHHGVFDTGYLALTPGITVLCPADAEELKQMLRWAVCEQHGPVAIRYPRGADIRITQGVYDHTKCVEILRPGKDAAIVTYGTLTVQALQAAELLRQRGKDVAVLRLQMIVPLPMTALRESLTGIDRVLVLEETMAQAAIAPQLALSLPEKKILCRNLGTEYVTHGDMASLYRHYGLDEASVADHLWEVLCDEK